MHMCLICHQPKRLGCNCASRYFAPMRATPLPTQDEIRARRENAPRPGDLLPALGDTAGWDEMIRRQERPTETFDELLIECEALMAHVSYVNPRHVTSHCDYCGDVGHDDDNCEVRIAAMAQAPAMGLYCIYCDETSHSSVGCEKHPELLYCMHCKESGHATVSCVRDSM